MRSCTRDGLWHRVAHAAFWLAEADLLGWLLNAKETCSRPPAPGQWPIGPDKEGHANPQEQFVVDDDRYRLDRDPGETDAEYQERALMLHCDKDGYIRLPRWKP